MLFFNCKNPVVRIVERCWDPWLTRGLPFSGCNGAVESHRHTRRVRSRLHTVTAVSARRCSSVSEGAKVFSLAYAKPLVADCQRLVCSPYQVVLRVTGQTTEGCVGRARAGGQQQEGTQKQEESDANKSPSDSFPSPSTWGSCPLPHPGCARRVEGVHSSSAVLPRCDTTGETAVSDGATRKEG